MTRGVRRLAPMTVTVALLGCAVDERAERDSYRALLDAPRAIADATDASLEESRAAPLDVLDAMRLANARNETLEIGGERYVQAIIDRRRVAAAFLPTITLAPSYLFRDTVKGLNSEAFDLPVNAGFAVSPVRDRARVRSAEATIAVRRADLFTAQDALLLDVARVHAQVLAAENAVNVLANSLKAQQVRVDDARGRFEAGVLRPLDVSSTEAQSAQTAVRLTEERTRVATGRALLGFLVAADLSSRPLADRLDPDPETFDLDALTTAALARRPERAAAAASMKAAQHDIESAYGQYYPAVAVNFQAFLVRGSAPETLDWTGLVRVSVPLFSAGVIEANVRAALSVLRQTRFADARLERSIRRDVVTAVENLRGADRRIEQLDVQVKSARDALAQAEGLFGAGLATNLERVDAQDRLLAAELSQIDAALDRKVFWLDLLRVTGRLHESIGLERAVTAESGRHAETR